MTTVATLSVVVNVCNEAGLLQDCLESVRWADEIIITDMHSTDASAEIYRQYTDKVFLIERKPIAEKVHNFAFAQATQDWVLLLAPDERVSPPLAAQIREVLGATSPTVAFRVPFKDYIFGKWIQYTGWQGNREIGLIRLFKRGKVHWREDVHTTPEVDGPIETIHYDPALDNAIIHLNYTSVSQFIEKLNRYTTAEAEKRFGEGKTFRWYKMLYHPLIDFWRRYVSGKGYKDGMHGFVLSVLMAIYAEIILIKMWEMIKDQPNEAV